MPKQRRTGLFSATLSGIDKQDLLKLGMRNPVKIDLKVSRQKQAANEEKKEEVNENIPLSLKNYYGSFKTREEKFYYLLDFLLDKKNDKIILFFNTCASVSFYHKLLSELKVLKGSSWV